MSASTGKRSRNATEAPVQEGALLDNGADAAPLAKRARPAADAELADGDAPPPGDVVEVDADEVIPDAAVAATAAVAQQALANAQPGLQATAAEKRARFMEKYPGKTPEQILGKSSLL